VRRLGVVAVLCGALFGLPLLLLQNGSTHAHHVASASPTVRPHGLALESASHLDSVVLPSHLVRYDAPVSVTPTTSAPVTAPAAPPPVAVTPTTVAPHVEVATPTTTPATSPAPTPVVTNNSEVGQATWYSEAPAGMCASPTLPFGTVVTVRNNATGATTQCTVDDREAAGYPRVVDMSYSGFSQIADPSQGVVDVTISW
jgi:rare lipoprotein A (peptidoglycan hydrolase)